MSIQDKRIQIHSPLGSGELCFEKVTIKGSTIGLAVFTSAACTIIRRYVW